MFTGQVRIMDRWEGALALLIYFLYIGYLVIPLCLPGLLPVMKLH
jgi:hypothetical protein